MWAPARLPIWDPAKNDRGKKLGPILGCPSFKWVAHIEPSRVPPLHHSNNWAAHMGLIYIRLVAHALPGLPTWASSICDICSHALPGLPTWASSTTVAHALPRLPTWVSSMASVVHALLGLPT